MKRIREKYDEKQFKEKKSDFCRQKFTTKQTERSKQIMNFFL